MEEELLESFESYLEDVHSIEEGMEIMMQAIRKDREIYLLLISDHGDPAFLHRLVSYSYDILKTDLKERLGHLPEQQRRWSYLFVAQGCIQVLLEWISDGCREDPAELSGFLAKAETAMMEHL